MLKAKIFHTHVWQLWVLKYFCRIIKKEENNGYKIPDATYNSAEVVISILILFTTDLKNFGASFNTQFNIMNLKLFLMFTDSPVTISDVSQVNRDTCLYQVLVS